MEEIWKPYPEDPRYLVSNTGFVKGPKGHILSGSITNGYYRIGLYNGKNKKYEFVHRIVAKTFIPNPENKPIINHKDGNKLNNNIDNLEWCTQQENVIHARDVLKISYQTDAAHEARKQKIKIIDIITKEEQIFNSIQECADFLNIKYQTIQYYLKTKGLYKKGLKYFEKVEE